MSNKIKGFTIRVKNREQFVKDCTNAGITVKACNAILRRLKKIVK